MEISEIRNLLTEMQEISNFRSEEHTSELQSRRYISYAVFCLKKKKKKKTRSSSTHKNTKT